MTERQAWLFLADAWQDASKGPSSNVVRAFVCGLQCRGLCSSISVLLDKGQITRKVYIKMCRRLGKESSTYLWPTTPEGAASRAEFCKTQARGSWSWIITSVKRILGEPQGGS
jgi:hypothetical protein